MPKCLWALVAAVLLLTANLALAQDSESKETKIARALSAAPATIAAHAKVVDMDAKGNMTELRAGDNGFTCVAGHLGVVGDPPACMDAAAMQWLKDWMDHKPKPTNTQPGVMYQLAGATDWSATDPWATSGTPHTWAPGWVLLWPFDPKAAGLSDQPKETGTWVMWAGTPYAHLMIMQTP